MRVPFKTKRHKLTNRGDISAGEFGLWSMYYVRAKKLGDNRHTSKTDKKKNSLMQDHQRLDNNKHTSSSENFT